jgi:hypothetical protein
MAEKGSVAFNGENSQASEKLAKSQAAGPLLMEFSHVTIRW